MIGGRWGGGGGIRVEMPLKISSRCFRLENDIKLSGCEENRLLPESKKRSGGL